MSKEYTRIYRRQQNIADSRMNEQPALQNPPSGRGFLYALSRMFNTSHRSRIS